MSRVSEWLNSTTIKIGTNIKVDIDMYIMGGRIFALYWWSREHEAQLIRSEFIT